MITHEEITLQKQIMLLDIQREVDILASDNKSLDELDLIEVKRLIDLYADSSYNNKQESSNIVQSQLNQILNKCSLIIDSYPVLNKPLLILIASIALIRNGIFVLTTMNYFYNRIIVNTHDSLVIKEVINDIVIGFLYHNPSCTFSNLIIEGLIPFISIPSFELIMINLIDHFKYYIAKTDMNTITNFPKFSAVLLFISQLKSLTSYFLDIHFLKSYYEILYYFITFPYINKHTSTDLEEDSIVKGIILDIGLLLFDYKNKRLNNRKIEEDKGILGDVFGCLESFSQGLENELQRYTKSKERIELSTFQRQCLGKAIILYMTIVSCLDKIKTYSKVIYSIITIINYPLLSDPIMIHAICKGIMALYNNNQFLLEDYSLFNITFSRLFLYDYLKGNGLKNCSLFLQKLKTKTNPVKIKNTAIDSAINKEFIELSNEILIGMFSAIIHLFSYELRLGMDDSNKLLGNICIRTVNVLNESNILVALIQMLSINNSKLKKTIIKCIYWLDFSSIKETNVQMLIKLIDYDSPLTKYLFLLFEKILLTSNSNYNQKSNDTTYPGMIKELYSIAYDYLMRLFTRECFDDKENDELLLIAILSFLNNTKEIYEYYFNREQCTDVKIYELLMIEDCQNEWTFPIEIERSAIGQNIKEYNECFIDGKFKLNPYSPVTIRIIHHIRNILLGSRKGRNEIKEYAPLKLKEILYEKKTELIMNEIHRFSYEEYQSIIIDVKGKEDTYKEILKIIPVMIDFLVMKDKDNNELLIKQIFDGYIINMSLEKNNERNPCESFKIENTEESVLDRVSRILKEKDLNTSESTYNYKCNLNDNVYDYLSNDYTSPYGNSIEYTTRIKSIETINNISLRSQVISSFLSILSILSQTTHKTNLINLLKSHTHLKDLILLIDSTKYHPFLILKAYLALLEVFIEDKDKEPTEEHYNIIFYSLEKIIKLYNQAPFSIQNNNHKQLITYLTRLIIKIININMFTIHFLPYSIIQFFINVIDLYMKSATDMLKQEVNNKHSSKDTSLFSFENELLSIALLLGEIAAKNKQFSSKVFEVLALMPIRKTFLREIIQINKMTQLRQSIESKLKLKIYNLNRCFTLHKIKYILLTDIGIQSLTFKQDKGDCNIINEWEISDEYHPYEINSKFIIHYETIKTIKDVEYANRVFVYLENSLSISFEFYKRTSAMVFKECLKERIERKERKVKYHIEKEEGFLCCMKEGKGEEGFECRIGIFNGSKFKIYSIDDDQEINGLIEFKSLLKEEKIYYMEEITAVTFLKADIINIEMNNKRLVQIQSLDDITYTFLRKKLVKVLISKGFGRYNKKK